MELKVNNKGSQMVKAPKTSPSKKPTVAKGGDLRGKGGK